MANEYLTLEQTCEALGKTGDEVKAMVADGRLSEVRDAGKVFFKKSEVDQIAAKEGSSIVDLALTDVSDAEETESFASALSSLADSSSSIGLLDEASASEEAAPAALEEPGGAPAAPAPAALDLPEQPPAAPEEISLEELPEELPAAPALDGELPELEPAPLAEEPLALDTGSASAIPDLGLSGSSILGIQEEPAKPAAPAAPAAAKPAKVGISVFDDDELPIAADPMGETQISATVPELEAVGSGSGLLDLTREKDDTSLGAELLGSISPGEAEETETEGATVEVVEADETIQEAEPGDAVVAEVAEAPEEEVMVVAPRRATAEMRGAMQLNVCLMLGLLGLAVAALATAAAIQGVWPSFLSVVARDVPHYSAFGGLALIAVVAGVLAILADRSK
jgi:hypothetical protein